MNLRDNQLSTLPGSISQWVDVFVFNITGNKFSTIPSSLYALSGTLQEFDMGRNPCPVIPDDISKFSCLQKFCAFELGLTDLPVSLSALRVLSELHLSGNAFTVLPASICDLYALQHLDCSLNKLSTLPASIGQLSELRTLLLHGNKLVDLPPEIGMLTQLKKLTIYDNFMVELESKLYQCTSLKEMPCYGNPLISPPPNVIQAGLSEILLFLKELDEQPEAVRKSKVTSLLSPAPEIKESQLLSDREWLQGQGKYGVIKEWFSKGVLDYDVTIWDGFFEVGTNHPMRYLRELQIEPFVEEIKSERPRESLLIDVPNDTTLSFLQGVVSRLKQDKKISDALLVELLVQLTLARFGGSPKVNIENVSAQIRSLISKNSTIVLPLGELTYGFCRHRALLFKLLCTWAGIPCRLSRGVYRCADSDGDCGAHVWCVVTLGEETYLMNGISILGRRYDGQMDWRSFSPYVGSIRKDERLKKSFLSTKQRGKDWEIPQWLVSILEDGAVAAGQHLTNFPWEIDFRELTLTAEDRKPARKSQSANSNKCSLGSWHEAEWQGSERLRVLHLDVAYGETEREIFYQILSRLHNLRHPHLVTFYGASLRTNRLYLLFESGARDLRTILREGIDITFAPIRRRILMQTASALIYLHTAGILHKSVRSNHVVVWNEGESCLAKLAAIGSHDLKQISLPPTNKYLGWEAPEVIKTQSYSRASDVYAFGMLCWECMTAKIPFADAGSQTKMLILQGDRPPVASGVKREWTQILKEMWQDDPAMRPSMRHILEFLQFQAE